MAEPSATAGEWACSWSVSSVIRGERLCFFVGDGGAGFGVDGFGDSV